MYWKCLFLLPLYALSLPFAEEAEDMRDYVGQTSNNVIEYSAIRIGGDFPVTSSDFAYAHLLFEKGKENRVMGLGLLLSGQKEEKNTVDVNGDTLQHNSVGLLLKYGYSKFASFGGYSVWTGLGVLPKGKYVKASVPVVLEGNLRLFSLIGTYLHVGLVLDHHYYVTPTLGIGFILVPITKFDFGGFE